MPIALTDPRRNHWDARARLLPGWAKESLCQRPARFGVAVTTLLACRLQVFVVYFHAAVAKFGVEEWADGTATYYWLLDSDFGVAPFLRAPIEAIVGVGAGVLLLTWGTLLVEILLALGLLARNSVRRRLFWLGVGFHAAIGILMGLVSFSLAMAGALLLYLWPPEHALPGASLVSLYRRANAGPTAARREAVT